jgi:FkbM family methyltransferase
MPSLYGLKKAIYYPRTAYLRRTRPIAEDHIRAMFELNYYQRSLYDFTAATMANPDILVDFDLDRDSVVLDVGAFVGNWSHDIAERFDPVIYAFEPATGPARSAERRLVDHPRATVCAYGLSDADQTASLSLNGPGASMYADPSKVQTATVEIRDVAAVLDELGIERVDLLKVNIEGAEYDLFDRLIETGWLPRIRQVAVQFHEWHPHAYRRRRAIRAALRRDHDEVWNYPWVWEYWRRPAQATSGT